MRGVIDCYASLPHYWAHLKPIWEALPPDVRGGVYSPRATNPWGGRVPARWPADRPVMVAGFSDYQRVAPRPVVYVEHGAGQTYGGDVRSAGNPSYSGGSHLTRVRLFICPGEAVAARWRNAYSSALVAAVGDPTLDADLSRARDTPATSTVAVTFHWDCGLVPETRSGWAHYARGIPEFVAQARAEGWRVLGHGHPRMWRTLGPWWQRLGVEAVRDLEVVRAGAQVLVADNTSAMWEWCALDRPVVVMDAPWYRPHVHHGLRFWEHSDVGPRVGDPEDLLEALRIAAADPPHLRANRAAAARAVYAHTDGRAAERAAAAVVRLLEEQHG